MNTITLKKKFRFEAAHRLGENYEGKCANIHGHSWNGYLEFEGQVKNIDKAGMLADYLVLKQFTKAIEDRYDHKLLLNIADQELTRLCQNKDWDYILFNDNPTSEIIALDIWNCLPLHNIMPGVKLVTICIEETCTTQCLLKIK